MGERLESLVAAMVRPGNFPNCKGYYISWRQNLTFHGTSRRVHLWEGQSLVSDDTEGSCCDESRRDCADDGEMLVKLAT